MSNSVHRSSQISGASPSSQNMFRPHSFFTENMRDRQARDKDPYSSSDDSDDYIYEPERSSRLVKESYEVLQKRRQAAVVLDNPELLYMYSQVRCDSVAATRHHFNKILCGQFGNEDDPPVSRVDKSSSKPKTFKK